MSRPPNPRHIATGLGAELFKPAGTPLHALEVVTLDLDGLEALRLADLVGLYHEAAAEMMGVSRATFGRVLVEARRRVSEALVLGKALRVGGGDVIESEQQPIPCPVHAQGRRRGRGCRCANEDVQPQDRTPACARPSHVTTR
jgi:predicted DNA-binding protein (UPF0251 family)